jgi:hypothetical protein
MHQLTLPFEAEAEPFPAGPPPDVFIPALDLGWQATELTGPVTRWGSIARSAAMGGTYHFYTCDTKFTALARDPHRLVASGCRGAVEPNYSTWPEMEPARFWDGVRLKRALACHWGRAGVKLIADLGVDPVFRAANFAGIPRGWRAYAVRHQRGIGLDEIGRDHAAACAHAGTSEILFIIVGGWRKVRDLCARRGWTWVAEDLHRARGSIDGTRTW